MAELPTGTVTLLFTDVEGSTTLLVELGRARYAKALARHCDILRHAFTACGGYEVDYEGDAFFVSFASAGAALAAATSAQRGLAAEPWPHGCALRVRMGIHTGEPLAVPPKYVGLDVHRAARIMAAGHGDQILLSERTAGLVHETLPDSASLRDLGEHRLKDLTEPQRLYQLVLAGLPSEFPPLNTLSNRPTNLPVQPNRFIGRTEELASITDLLRERETRLLTLTGPGGTGKTRVALQVGAELVDEFADGVYAVFLGQLRDPDLVAGVVAKTLGLRERADQTLEETLIAYLRERQLLLVLDNFEHLLDAAASTARLLAHAPRLVLLVTSREPLHVAAERLFEVPPLSVPAQDAITPAAVLTHDSVVLFLERARAARADFELNDANAVAIAEICTRLDGLPLALELAAARIRALSPEALGRRLDQRLSLLTGGARDADERQRTLRATIEWSYDLLANEEKSLFGRLSVFTGGCRPDAAEAVGNPGGELGIDTMDGLASLVDKSLLRQRNDADGEPRFWMLETIREYAKAKLRDDKDERLTADRHRACFLQLAEEAKIEMEGRDQEAWFDRVELEIGNFRSMLETSYGAGGAETLCRGATALLRFWWVRGYLAEGRRWTSVALELSSSASPELRAKVLEAAAYFANRQGAANEAMQRIDHALVLGHGVLDATDMAQCWLTKGLVATASGDSETAASAYGEALAISRSLGDERGVARATGNLADLALVRGKYEEAAAHAEESLALARSVGALQSIHTAMFNRALAAVFLGNYGAARNGLMETLALIGQFKMREGFAVCFEGFAAIEVVEGDAERAARFLGRAEALLEEIGSALHPAERRLHDQTVDRLHRELDDDLVAAAWGRGRMMSTDDAIEEAIAVSGVEAAPRRPA
jgi:predicted ATPase/class 3 adenylate cyclase